MCAHMDKVSCQKKGLEWLARLNKLGMVEIISAHLEVENGEWRPLQLQVSLREAQGEYVD